MGFSSGFSGKSGGGRIKVISGSHGQILRFHSGSNAIIGTDDHKIDDEGLLSVTGSLNLKGQLSHSGSIVPESNDALGSGENKYSNVHTDVLTTVNMLTGDLHLRNERGDWTIFEEKSSLVVQNNITGERFKLVMEKIED
jgi:hypothetical protein